MKRFLTATAALAILAGGIGGASAQSRDNDRHDDHPPAAHGNMMGGPAHHDWRKGGHIERNDWSRGERVDYKRYHLQRPPRGYEWRRVDNNYVLAAAATGLIASIMLANQ
jgi:Ni/Co efflux regulator RcnB